MKVPDPTDAEARPPEGAVPSPEQVRAAAAAAALFVVGSRAVAPHDTRVDWGRLGRQQGSGSR